MITTAANHCPIFDLNITVSRQGGATHPILIVLLLFFHDPLPGDFFPVDAGLDDDFVKLGPEREQFCFRH